MPILLFPRHMDQEAPATAECTYTYDVDTDVTYDVDTPVTYAVDTDVTYDPCADD